MGISHPFGITFLFGKDVFMKNNIEEFKKHVNNYNVQDENIKRKLVHSIRVMKISKYLAKKLKLSKLDIHIAELIGLLHDYARFEQWTKYKTFSDLNSIDHGDLGVELLFNENNIKKYDLNEEDYELVYNSIKYHNKYDYPKTMDDLNETHCKIIRDSDKLDILYICSKNKRKISKDDKISKKAQEDFYKKILVSRKDIKSTSDEILLELSWVFDINYKESYKYLKKKKYIWKLFRSIDNKEKFLKYFKYADKYIKERLK